MFGTKFGQTPLFLQAKKQHRAIFRSFMGGAAADDDEGAGPPQWEAASFMIHKGKLWYSLEWNPSCLTLKGCPLKKGTYPINTKRKKGVCGVDDYGAPVNDANLDWERIKAIERSVHRKNLQPMIWQLIVDRREHPVMIVFSTPDLENNHVGCESSDIYLNWWVRCL